MFPLVPIAAVLGIGVLAVGALTFWSALQNWLSNLVYSARNQLGFTAEALQNALVIMDKVMVNGQRVIVATARVFFKPEAGEPTVAEEARVVSVDELPPDVRARLEAGEPITYELSVGSMQLIAPPQGNANVTYKLAVRRAD